MPSEPPEQRQHPGRQQGVRAARPIRTIVAAAARPTHKKIAHYFLAAAFISFLYARTLPKDSPSTMSATDLNDPASP